MHFSIPKFSRTLLLFSLLTAVSGLQPVKAEANQTPLHETIDLSPGVDVYKPDWLALNRSTHKLYVASMAGVKVVDTAAQTAITGIPFATFRTKGITADESPAPLGNKIYVVGSGPSASTALRVIDGETDTNLTVEGTDLILPSGDGQVNHTYTANIVVNPTNHKVYLSTSLGRVVVVDGPNRQVLGSLALDAGGLLVVNPAGNKVFVLGKNGGAIIDSATDTATPLSLGIVSAKAAVFNPANGRIYLAAQLQDRSGIFALDGVSGAILAEKTDLSRLPDALTVSPEQNHLYATQGTSANPPQIVTYEGTNLGFITSTPALADKVTYDSVGGGKIFHLEDSPSALTLHNTLGILDRATGALSKIPVGYTPAKIAVNNQTNRFYVADQSAPELQVMDGETHEVIARVPVRPTKKNVSLVVPYGDIAVSEKLNRFYFPRAWPAGSSTVDVYDGATNQLRSTIFVHQDIKSSLGAVEVDDQRGLIYVSATRDAGGSALRDLIFVFDAQTEMPKATVTLGLETGAGLQIPHMTLNAATGDVYFLLPNGTLQIIDGDSHTQKGSIVFEGRGTAIAANSQSNKIFVATDPDNDPVARIVVIDGATGLVEKTFSPSQFGQEISNLAVDPESNILYAGDGKFGPGIVAAFDAGNNYRYLGALEYGNGVRSLAFSSAANQLLIANSLDGTVGILRPERWKLFGNISTRGRVGPSSDDVLIGGFIVDGPPGSTKKVVVRAIGPSLADNGVANAVPDTTIELHDSLGNVITNDNWKINDSTKTSQEAAIVATGVPPRNDAESAIIAQLPPGPCTAVVRGKNGQAGVALIEVYNIDLAPNAQLANISTRGSVGTADSAMIGGLIVQGLQPSRVVMRAIGPAMEVFGVAGTLQDPTLELRNANGSLVEFNDDWKRDAATGTSQEAEILATNIPPTDDRESAIVVTLVPGQYTAVVRGKADTTGVALVEAYNIE